MRIREEAQEVLKREPLLASFVYATALNHQRLEQALSYHLAQKLGSHEVPAILLREVFDECYAQAPDTAAAARADLVAIKDRDPACHTYLQPLLFFKGFLAVQAQRVGHWLWRGKRWELAMFLQSRVSETFGVDAHPAARIGRGIMIDHATGVVIGETTIIEDDVSILHAVTLGGTGKEEGQRHPTVRRGVLLGAGAKILGDVEIGECSKVAAGSVVTRDVPPRTTVAGVPAKIIGETDCTGSPSLAMDQRLEVSGGDETP
ncbi:MAG: serine O-acetyltransferase [Alphaproteobacteria bacterium]